jgi:hypothetical protein
MRHQGVTLMPALLCALMAACAGKAPSPQSEWTATRREELQPFEADLRACLGAMRDAADTVGLCPCARERGVRFRHGTCGMGRNFIAFMDDDQSQALVLTAGGAPQIGTAGPPYVSFVDSLYPGRQLWAAERHHLGGDWYWMALPKVD